VRGLQERQLLPAGRIRSDNVIALSIIMQIEETTEEADQENEFNSSDGIISFSFYGFLAGFEVVVAHVTTRKMIAILSYLRGGLNDKQVQPSFCTFRWYNRAWSYMLVWVCIPVR